MAKPFSALPSIMDERIAQINMGIDMVVRNGVESAGRSVLLATRVDTGEARSNWRASLNTPLSGTIPPYAPGERLGQGETANLGAASAQQRQVVRQFKPSREGAAMFITNNVDHIGDLDRGFTSPAGNDIPPANFLRAAAQGFKVGLRLAPKILK